MADIVESVALMLKLEKMRGQIREYLPDSFAKACATVHPILDALKPDNPIGWALQTIKEEGWEDVTAQLVLVATLEWITPTDPANPTLLERLSRI